MAENSLKFADILRCNARDEAISKDRPRFTVAILGNVSAFQCGDYLRHRLFALGVNPQVEFGDYDNIVQDSEKFQDRDCVIVFQELCNLVDGFQGKAEIMSEETIGGLAARVVAEFDLLARNLAGTRSVIFNLFSAAAFSDGQEHSNLARLGRKLNETIQRRAPKHFFFFDLDQIFLRLSLDQAINWRDFYLSKMLYTTRFFDAYTKKCVAALAPALGKAKKALVFDCDNALWKGIVGEDGVEGIRISPPFAEVQALAKALAPRGVILALCSKNNPEDVAEVFAKRADMVLAEEDILARRINWQDKATNLKELAAELNIGVDSLVLVDDSDFECGLVREQLPEVTVLQVPGKAHDYPRIFRDHLGLFHTTVATAEDKARLLMYRQEGQRKNAQQGYANIEDYLRSLELKVTTARNAAQQVPRLAQLTQKTNQFNLTTRRYSESQVASFVQSSAWMVQSISVADKYGEYGITGLCLANMDGGKAVLDTFLLSCRIIGRNIEFKFLEHVLGTLARTGIREVEARYIRTIKNGQVWDFWDRAGFDLIAETEQERHYRLSLESRAVLQLDYISLIE